MLECDNCKKTYTNEHSGFSIYVDESSVSEEASDDNWYMNAVNDKHYCPDCYKINEADEVFIKTIPAPEEGSQQESWVYLQEN